MNPTTLHRSLLALAAAASLTACSDGDDPLAERSEALASRTPDAVTSPGALVDPGPDSTVVPVVDPAKPLGDAKAVLQVEDQTSEGPTVNVKAAALAQGGLVVVFADGGANTLGYGAVPAGGAPSLVQVALAEEVLKRTQLVARLYTDADGDGVFSAADRPVSNGKADEDDDLDAFPGEQEVFAFTGKALVNG